MASGPQQHAASQPNLQTLSLASPAAPFPASTDDAGGAAPLPPVAAPRALRSDAAADALRAAFQAGTTPPAAAQGSAAIARAAAAAAAGLVNGHAHAAASSAADADEPMPDAPASPASPPHAAVDTLQHQGLDSHYQHPSGRQHHIAGVSNAAWVLLQQQSPQPQEPPPGLRSSPRVGRRSASPGALGRRSASPAAAPPHGLGPGLPSARGGIADDSLASGGGGGGVGGLRPACELLIRDRARNGSPAASSQAQDGSGLEAARGSVDAGPASDRQGRAAGWGASPLWQRRPQLWHPQHPDQPGAALLMFWSIVASM